MATRKEFSKRTKLAVWARSNGRCECGCGTKIIARPEYHHIIPAALGGDNDADNCRLMSVQCHRVQTSTIDKPEISKSVRIFEKSIGARKSKGRGFQGWRLFNGEVRHARDR